MANTKIQATATLFLDTKNAQRDAKQFVEDIRQKLSDIESAADKMKVFKDVVEYIAQIDRALSALRANNKDAFAHMFDGLDTNLKKQLEGLFGIDSSKLGQIDVLREKLDTLTPKSSIKEFRAFAKEINDLYTSIGAKVPFNDISTHFYGRADAGYIDDLKKAVSDFAIVWEDVGSRISKGLGNGSGAGGGTGGVGTGAGAGISNKIQQEIAALENQLKTFESIRDRFQDVFATMSVASKKGDGTIPDSYKIDLTVESITKLMDEYDALDKKMQSLEQGSVDYYNTLGRMAEISLTFKKALSDIRADESLLQLFKSTQGGRAGNKGNMIGDISYYANTKSSGISKKSSEIISDAEIDGIIKNNQILIEKLKSGAGDLSSLYGELRSKIQEYYDICKQINAADDTMSEDDFNSLLAKKEKLEEIISDLGNTEQQIKKIDDALRFLSNNTVSGIESTVDQISKIVGIRNIELAPNVDKSVSIYDELFKKIHEYYAIYDKINNDLDLTDDQTDNLYNNAEALEKYFFSLDKVGDKQKEIRTLLGNLSSGELDSNVALERLCNLLGVEIPKEVTKASESISAIGGGNTSSAVENIGDAADTSKKKVDALTESIKKAFIQATELELSGAKSKETMSLFGADGTISSATGIDRRVDTDTIASQLISNLKNNIVMSLHNHANGNDMFSPQDLESFAKLYYGQGTKINGIIVDGMVKTIDFTGISQELAIKIAQSYAEGIQSIVSKNSNLLTYRDGHVDYTDFARQLEVTNPDVYKEMILAVQSEINECLNNAFLQNGVQPTIKQFEHTQLPELAKHLSEIQQNAQASLSPVEKLQNLLSAMYPDKSFNWGDYTEIFEKFSSGAIDGTQAINKILNLETVSSQVDQAKAKYQELYQFIESINKSGKQVSATTLGQLDGTNSWDDKSSLDIIKEKQKALSSYLTELIKIQNQEAQNGALAEQEAERKKELIRSIRDLQLSVRYKDGSHYSTADFGEDFDKSLEEQIMHLTQIVNLRKQIALGFHNTGVYGTVEDTFSGDKLSSLLRGSISSFDSVDAFNDSVIGQLIREYQELHEQMLKCMLVGEEVPAGTMERLKWFESLDASKLEQILPRLEELQTKISAITDSGKVNKMVSFRYGKDESYYDEKIRSLQELIQLKTEYEGLGGIKDEDYSLEYLQRQLDTMSRLKEGVNNVRNLKAELTNLFPDIDLGNSSYLRTFENLQEGAISYTDAMKEAKRVYDSLYARKAPADIYAQSTDSVKALIDQLMLAEQKIATFSERTAGVKLDNFNPHDPTDFQKNYILAAYDELKKVQQEIANMPILKTEDDKQKLRELQEEALRLYRIIQQAHLADGNPQSYARTYGLSSEDAAKFMSLAEGGEAYKLRNSLLAEYKNEHKIAFDEISKMHDTLTQHILVNGEKWTQFGKEQLGDLYSGQDYQKMLDDKLSAIVSVEATRQQEIAAIAAQRNNLVKEFKASIGFTDAFKSFDDSQFDAFDTVLEQIKNGTITTVDQCVKKFNELSGSLQQAVGQVGGATTGVGVGVATGIGVGGTAGAVDTTLVSNEISQLEVLRTKLLEIKAAVDSKTVAFEEEHATVDAVVDAEVTYLQKLIDKLAEVIAQIKLVNDGFAQISANTPSLNVGSKPADNVAANDVVSAANAVTTEIKSVNLATEAKQLKNLRTTLIDVKNAVVSKTKAFNDEGKIVGQVVGKEIAALKQLSGIVDDITPKISSLVAGLVGLNKQSVAKTKTTTTTSTTTATTPNVEQSTFDTDKQKQIVEFEKYCKSIEHADYLTEELKSDLDQFGKTLRSVANESDLGKLSTQLEGIKANVDAARGGFEKLRLGAINSVERELTTAFSKLTTNQQGAIADELQGALTILEKYKVSVKDGKNVELEAINAVVAALREKIKAYEAQNSSVGQGKSNKKFGSTALMNAQLRVEAIRNQASSQQFANSQVVVQGLKQLEDAYEKLIEKKRMLESSDTRTKEDELEFKRLTKECNAYASALERVIKNSTKSRGESATKPYMLGDDFVDNAPGREAALTAFVQQLEGVDASTISFKKNYEECIFTINNGDGTVSKMTARFTDARNEIVTFANETKQVTSAVGNLWNEFKKKLGSVGTYFAASFSIYRVWAIIKQGVQYVKEIDSALTELKKVTDETDASYSKFLQDMSKTGSTVGATVKDLTTMAAEWARLGYSMKEAGELAKSTAILLNVSEFDDATKASEALISTMQAFQYTANESQHVVDVLNEVGEFIAHR